jgi:DNA-binding transcriptional LysR family regulator
MEDHRLRAFCLVVELKSFSKAAEAKSMTQSAMSHLIRNLEDELGIQLLNRQRKIVAPTPAGGIFYYHAKRILAGYGEMENDVFAFARKICGPLHMSATITIGTYLLPQVFYSFSKKNPEVKIELTVSNTGKIIDDLHEGRIELGIVEGNIRDSSVFAEEIAEDEIVVIASEDSPLAGKSLTPRALAAQQFIMPEAGSGTREFIDDFLKGIKVDPGKINVAMTLGNPALIIRMVQSGIGISMVSKWSVFQAVKEGSIKLLLMPEKSLRRKFYLVRSEKTPVTVAAKSFWGFMREYRFFVPF